MSELTDKILNEINKMDGWVISPPVQESLKLILTWIYEHQQEHKKPRCFASDSKLKRCREGFE
jgi:hypothetical protein